MRTRKRKKPTTNDAFPKVFPKIPILFRFSCECFGTYFRLFAVFGSVLPKETSLCSNTITIKALNVDLELNLGGFEPVAAAVRD